MNTLIKKHFSDVEQYLPESAKEIICVIGHERAIELFSVFGGVGITFSANSISPGTTEANSMIKLLIGEQAHQALCKHFGYYRIYIPRCTHALIAIKRKKIINEFFSRLQSGATVLAAKIDVCKLYGVSEREVHKLIKKHYETARLHATVTNIIEQL
ncbi:Mor transcription activator family protein [Escherichia coli]